MKNMHKRIAVIGKSLLATAILLVAFIPTACTTKQSTTTPFSTVGMITQSKNIASGTFIVGGGGYRDIVFNVDALSMYKVQLTGYFHVTGGAQNDIEAFIIDDTVYSSWSQGRSVTPLYNTGRKTYAEIKFDMPASSRRYHLVFNNVFSGSVKTIQAEIEMKYFIKAPTTTTDTTSPE